MDTQMGDGRETEPDDDASDVKISLPLSEKEKRILELYDRLLEVEVELALTRGRQDATIGAYSLVYSPEMPFISISCVG